MQGFLEQKKSVTANQNLYSLKHFPKNFLMRNLFFFCAHNITLNTQTLIFPFCLTIFFQNR